MRHLLFLLLILIPLSASNLLTYNIYERSDRVDVMLSFDAPYEGNIYQKKGANIISLTLNDLIFDQLVEKNINSNIVQEMMIEPSKNSTIVTLRSEQDISVIASKTIDGFGLRIRSKLLAPSPTTTTQQTTTSTYQTPSEKSIAPRTSPLSGSDLIDTRYIMVISIMLVLLVFLLWIKRRIKKQTQKSGKVPANWLFKNAATNEMMNVLYQKQLDGNNKVVLFEFQGTQYLVMTGMSNVLLDRFGKNNVQSDGEFQELFEQNRQKLDDYLKLQNNQLNNYKEKVSQDFTPHKDLLT